MIIKSKNVWVNEQFCEAKIIIEDGIIKDVISYDDDVVDIDYGDLKIIPGLVDIHSHGYNGMNANYATYDGLLHWTKQLCKEGVTSYLVTTSTANKASLLKSMEIIANVMERNVDGANILGIHMEGPLISFECRGAQSPYDIQKPDVEDFKDFEKASKDHIRLVCIASEMDKDHKLIKYCHNKNIKVTLGHTNASYEECLKAFEDGADSFTHTFNGMNSLHHRKPGVPGAAMSIDEMYAECICDGVHVHKSVVKALSRCKGKDKLILVTDAVQIKGLKPGVYEFVDRTVTIGEDGCGRLANGKLAGSSNSMIKMLANAIAFGIDEVSAINACTKNPCELLNEDHKGIIAKGYDADLVVIDNDYNVKETYVLGKSML